eukprot:CAMPEP_0206049988 /NCGR_PEP_ID=MMETSP1466-20131121/28090_1 /ASSEMBLY_ACC=CAM_ASM_001126 /TAXON_ID=44452 /ORGANISM="Pavlova gyrans, Strain CCMP608" /LENGTH=270 /DNA_ID=CAMNT_0053425091 /DNA_START=59 /DNA_END=867 /DNA_ORIENTATION=+
MSLIREYESKLPPDTLAKYRRTFDQFDRDGGGDVDVRELGVMFRALRQFPTDRELQRMVEDVDDDGSRTVDFNEFCGLMLRLSRAKQTPRWLRLALDEGLVHTQGDADDTSDEPRMDANGRLDLSGRLTTEDLQLMAADLVSSAPSLRALVLSANPVSADGFVHIAAALLRSKLHTLGLAHCALGDTQAGQLAEMLRLNSTITHIDLRDNQITDRGLLEIGAAIREANNSLQVLRIKGNRGVGVEALTALEPLLLRNSLASAIDGQLPDV